MKTLPVLGLIAAGLAGFLAGNRPETVDANERVAEPVVARPVAAREAASPSSAKVAARRSGDSLEDLKTLPGTELYSRLALWLVDASADEIAACWAAIGDGARREVVELIFLNWTRLDPHGALAAVKGGEHEYQAWRGWACNDPVGALAAAGKEGQQRTERVGSAIGEFHPDWVREHWDELPFPARWYAIQGLSRLRETLDPWEDAEFLKKRKMPFDQRQLEHLVRDDPWRALDWIREVGWKAGPAPYDPEEVFFSTLADEHPEVLNRGMSILTDNSEGWSRAHIPEVEAVFDRVMVEAPGRMMEAVPVEVWRGGPHTALQNLAGRWAKTDAEALGEWIESSSDIPRRNQAVNILVEHLNGQGGAPEAAVEWMLAYPGALIQEHIAADAYRKWAQQQPEDARALLGQPDAPRNARVYIGQILSEEP